MGNQIERGLSLGAEITRASSKQTYYTFRFLADRERVEDAYRAYGYFRWVDDILDAPEVSPVEQDEFLKRQRELLEASYQGTVPHNLTPEETMLVELIQNDAGDHPGLRLYLFNMMAVMEIDVKRRGKVVSQAELDEYTRHLAVSVMEAFLYFIGHDAPPPEHYSRYHAVTAAHIVHMLRDTYEDIEMGYYNVPGEYLQAQGLPPQKWDPAAYQKWVRKRVQLARTYFKVGREYILQIKNFRCRLAGFAYIARFKVVLKMIEQDNYLLQKEYNQRKSIWSVLKMVWSTLISMLSAPCFTFCFDDFSEQSIEIEE
jgi:phytoene/squalene synthetase